MKATFKRTAAAAMSVLMVALAVLTVPTLNAKAFDNSVKQGVIAIVFYLKNAGIYITDGTNIEEVKHVGDTEFSGGSGFFIGDKEDAPTYIVTNCHVIDSYVKANEGETFLYNTGQLYQDTYPILIGAPAEAVKKDGQPWMLELTKDKYYDTTTFVKLSAQEDDKDIIYVDNDNYSACKELTSILIAKGLKRLALIGGSTEHIITRTRFKGFADAFEEAGVNIDSGLIYLDVESMSKIGNILKDLRKKNIDGVICMDDNIAGEVISRCRDDHVKIPDDLRVASFYNSSILESAIPSVTSLNFNDRNLGAVAAKTLLDIIDNVPVTSKMLGGYEVILKESTK
jgi:hypothetical protein